MSDHLFVHGFRKGSHSPDWTRGIPGGHFEYMRLTHNSPEHGSILKTSTHKMGSIEDIPPLK
jgi:hypothetical protein